MRDLTDKPFGVNIAQAFVRDPTIVEFVIDQGVKFVTTSAGSPDEVHARRSRTPGSPCSTSCRRWPRRSRRSTPASTGSSSRAARAAGSRARRRSSTMVLLPLVRSAGRRADHRRRRHRRRRRRWRPRSPSAPRACRWAPAWCRPPSRRCTTTGSRRSSTPPRPTRVFLNQRHSPALRALRTERTDGARARRAQRLRRLRQRPGPLLRRRHGGGDRPQRPGRRAHRRRPPGRRHHRRHGQRVRRHHRSTAAPEASHDATATTRSCGSSDGGVGTLTINRPEQFNGMTNTMLRETHELLHDVADDEYADRHRADRRRQGVLPGRRPQALHVGRDRRGRQGRVLRRPGACCTRCRR